MRTREGVEPICPFCRRELARPAEIKISSMETVLGGTCGGCGAIYVMDPTGKNVGEVMMQALGMAAEQLSKDSSQMVQGVDYEDAILNYDWRTHRSSGLSRTVMDRSGRLYVIKVNQG